MERGLLWLPLLIVFFWLAWAGWREFQKVEAYQQWAKEFDRAKYDIYTVLGQKDRNLTWGKPTRSDMVELQTFSLDSVRDINLVVDGETVSLEALPKKGKSAIAFSFDEGTSPILVPFTDISLAAQWTHYLQNQLQSDTENSKPDIT
jgi:hypothetical protein